MPQMNHKWHYVTSSGVSAKERTSSNIEIKNREGRMSRLMSRVSAPHLLTRASVEILLPRKNTGKDFCPNLDMRWVHAMTRGSSEWDYLPIPGEVAGVNSSAIPFASSILRLCTKPRFCGQAIMQRTPIYWLMPSQSKTASYRSYRE